MAELRKCAAGAVLLVVGAGVARGQCQEGWSEAFTPAIMSARTSVHGVLLEDGGRTKLVVADMRRAGAEDGLQVWDGSSWTTWPIPGWHYGQNFLLQAVDGALPTRLLVALEASGGTTTLLERQGGTWIDLGFPQGVTGAVESIVGGAEPGSGELYVGGTFRHDNDERTGVYRWDGAVWTALDRDRAGGRVIDLLWFDDGSGAELFASLGWGSTFNGVAIEGIAAWDGQSWSQVGDGDGCPARWPSLAAFDDGSGERLWALDSQGSENVLARWNGAAWESFPLDPEIWGNPSELSVAEIAGRRELVWHGWDHIARWDGVDGEQLAGLESGLLYHMVTGETQSLGGGVIALGSFIRVGDEAAACVARFDGQAWHDVGTSEVGNGAPSASSILAVGQEGGEDLGGRVYVAGSKAGGEPLFGVAAWDGSAWEHIGPLGLDLSSVRDLLLADLGQGATLVAAGALRPEGESDYQVMAWDGESWSVLGDGLNGWVETLEFGAVGGGEPMLFVGGRFTSIDGVAHSYVAGLTDHGWVSLGGGIPADGDPVVLDLALHDDGSGVALYAACAASSELEGALAYSVVRWDGQTWQPVGAPLGSPSVDAEFETLCSADTGDGPRLYAGGWIRGGWENVFVWDGVEWERVGSGLPLTPVQCLERIETPAGARLAAALWRTNGGAGEMIYLWDGASWSPFGAKGLVWASRVEEIAQASHEGGALYIIGNFVQVSGVPSEGIARWGCIEECAADFNGDGVVDTRDFVAFLNAWAGGDDAADFDGNGMIDTRDFIAFLNAWSAGC